MARVSLDRVSKRFPDGTVAVDEISLEIFDREFLVLVGPSGCGKSTTLRMIAGLETCTEGTIRIGDRVVNHVAPKDRDIAMVFQNYALYPHMSVYKNLSFGLTLRYGGGVIARGLRKIFQPRRAKEFSRLESAQLNGGIDGQVRQTANRLGIQHLLDRKPHQLSGGERQRVALGRAIVRNPAAFLFDEPLSNLDAKLRQQMRVELRRLHRELQATMIYVTHDQVEAMTLGDRVAVMNEGKVLQVGDPLEVYQHPASLFVARFIGSVPMNLVSGVVEIKGGVAEFRGGGFSIDIELSSLPLAGQGLFSGREIPRDVVLGFRAEDMDASAGGDVDLSVDVSAVDQLGESTLIHGQVVPVTDGSVAMAGDGSRTKESELDSRNSGQADSLVVRMPANSNVGPGGRLNLKIDQNKMLWFDPVTGQNLLKDNYERQ